MAIQLTIELPEDVFSLLRKSPTELVGELRLAAAVKWYELGMILDYAAIIACNVDNYMI